MVKSNNDPPGFEGEEKLITYLAREQWLLEKRHGEYYLTVHGRDVLGGPLGEGHEIIEILEMETNEDLKRINDRIEAHPEFGANRED